MIDMVLTVIVLSLGAARVTALIVLDEIMQPIRHRIFLLSPPHDDQRRGLFYQGLNRDGSPIKDINDSREAGFFGRLLSCFKCTSFWVGVMFFAAWSIFPVFTITASMMLAITFLSSVAVGRYY